MVYGYTFGSEQPAQYSISPGRMTAGFAIGILQLDGLRPLLPGDVSNATTFNFPVLYKVMQGITLERVLRADPSIIVNLIEGGKELEKQGVRAISTNCGFFGHYQKELAAALDVPVFTSSLLQIPLIRRALKPNQKVGIITAESTSLSASLLSACGTDDLSTIVVAGIQDLPESKNIPLMTGNYNGFEMERELVNMARQLVSDNPDIGALLLECANLPPFAWSIQKAVNLPVFDFITMINWLYEAVVKRPFAGFM